MMDIDALKKQLFEKARKKGFEDCELYYSENSHSSVSVYKGKLEKYQNSQTGGFCFRGSYNGSMGYYFSETTDIDIDSVIDNAMANADITDTDNKEFISEGSKSYSSVKIYNDALNGLTVEQKLETALEMERSALDYDKRIRPERASVSTGEGSVYIANTKGLELSEKRNYALASVSVMAEENGNTKSKYELFVGNDIEDLDPAGLGISAAKKAVSALGGSPVKSGSMNIILSNEVFADILGCFLPVFYAEEAHKGFSVLKDKTGERIASDILTIRDDPLIDGGFASCSFDSEGTASYGKNVIENGVLKTLLYNLKSAARDNVRSTGNGFKASFKSAVMTSATNFFVEKGNKTLDEVMKKTGEGLFITDVAGLHSGADRISGDFSLAAEGFRIENGVITSPVDQITIGGNFYDMLNNITAIADDLKFFASVGSPSVAVKNMTVGGL